MATATLALRRNGRVYGRRHAWQILLDGKPAGTIADDDAARPPAEPAPYLAAVIRPVHQPGAVLRRRRRGGGQLHLPADLAAGRRRRSSCPVCGSASDRSEAPPIPCIAAGGDHRCRDRLATTRTNPNGTGKEN